MLREVHMHGRLGERYASVIKLDADTVGSIVRALSIQLPGFAEALREGAYQIVRGDLEEGLELGLEDINSMQLGHADLHIVPVIAGSKDGGATLKAVIGVALVGTAFALSGGTLATPIMLGSMATGMTWGNVAMIGIGMALTGVSGFLSPDQKSKSDTDSSFMFNGPTNSYKQGSPVPLVYGDVITGGLVASAGIDIEKLQ